MLEWKREHFKSTFSFPFIIATFTLYEFLEYLINGEAEFEIFDLLMSFRSYSKCKYVTKHCVCSIILAIIVVVVVVVVCLFVCLCALPSECIFLIILNRGLFSSGRIY